MHKSKLILSLLIVFGITAGYAQQNKKETPKLIVGITIDRLRSDYLQLFFDGFGNRGFKRLMKDGLVYTDVRFDFPKPDKSSSVATIYTGANPSYTGIVSDKTYDAKSKKIRLSLFDARFMGNYTSETLSPKNLLVSTIGDELKVAAQGLCEVYAIAPESQTAIIAAGHTGDGAFWIDDATGDWATTTYYKEIPSFVDRYNRGSSLSSTGKSKTWVPLQTLSSYIYLPFATSKTGFRYTYDSYNRFKALKTSPLVNEEVNRLVERFFENTNIGQKNVPDFLSIAYYAGTPDDDKIVSDYSMELQDTYFRLDKNLEKLLELIDKKVGLQNAVIFVTSSGYFNEKEPAPSLPNYPVEDFYPKRCLALLNMYLMAIYGQENWVDTYYDRQIFLNRKLIESKQISLKEIQDKAAEFLIEFGGIREVFTAFDILYGRRDDVLRYVGNGFHQSVSGDLLLKIQPGRKIIQEDSPSDKDEYVHFSHIPAPLIISGANVPAQTIHRKTDATQIAPTICRLLHIRTPNASTAEALPEIQ